MLQLKNEEQLLKKEYSLVKEEGQRTIVLCQIKKVYPPF